MCLFCLLIIIYACFSDFQKAAAVIHEFQLKLSEDVECAELRDALNLALLHMQRYYRRLRSRLTQDPGHLLATSVRGLSPMTPFKDAPDKFVWRWVNLDNPRTLGTLPADLHNDTTVLPMVVGAAKQGHNDMLMQIIERSELRLECFPLPDTNHTIFFTATPHPRLWCWPLCMSKCQSTSCHYINCCIILI